jgi:hypothetical protein
MFSGEEHCGHQVITLGLPVMYHQRLFSNISENNKVMMVDAIPPPVKTGGLLATFY